MEYFTSPLSSSFPWWNLTPSRKKKVYSRPSLEISQDLAKSGYILTWGNGPLIVRALYINV